MIEIPTTLSTKYLMNELRIAIHGAAGRMGARLISLGKADPTFEIVAALDRADHPRMGEDVGILAGLGAMGLPLTSELDRAVDVLIDFSTPRATDPLLKRCIEKHIPLVFATTGITGEQEKAIHAAAMTIPVLFSPSMSMTVILAMKLSEFAAKALKDKDADVEIIERHHRYKADAPSGTALKFGQIIAAQMGQTVHRHGREGKPGERPHGEIGYHAVRIGDNPGEHSIIFGLLGETLEINVKATNRDCYALGALAAAKFLVGKPAGMYTMNDVLGI